MRIGFESAGYATKNVDVVLAVVVDEFVTVDTGKG